MNTTNKYINIAFDLGPCSIGWSVMDTQFNILDAGVRLFNDPSNPKDGSSQNVSRIRSRRVNRTIRRKKTKLKDLLKFYIQQHYIKDREEFFALTKKYQNVIDIAIKALTAKISFEELLVLLYWLLKRNGTFLNYGINKLAENDQKVTLKNDAFAHYNKQEYPVIALSKFYQKFKYYRNAPFGLEIKHDDWLNQNIAILDNQNCPKELREKFLQIFNRRRLTIEGPGSKKYPSKYGIWRLDVNNQPYKIADNLFWLNRGKCVIYSTEYKASKNTPLLYFITLLNRLNKFNLDSVAKTRAINYLNKEIKVRRKSGIYIKNLLKSVTQNVTDETIKNKIIVPSNLYLLLDFLHKYKKELNISFEEFDIGNTEHWKIINKIFDEFYTYIYENKNVMFTKLKEKYSFITIEDVDNIYSNFTKKDGSGLYSYKFMLEYLEKWPQTNKDLSEYVTNNQPRICEQFINKNLFNDSWLPSSVKRIYNQTILVLNELLKKYADYTIVNVNIENTQNVNTYEEKRKIDTLMRSKINLYKQFSNILGIDVNSLSKPIKTKLSLWNEQKGMDVYDGQKIDLHDILKNPHLYQIDHVIPKLYSASNSYDNLVLTKSVNNLKKGERTPFEYLQTTGYWNTFVQYINNNVLFSDFKKENLLYTKNIKNTIFDFVNHTLNDTRYITVLMLNRLNIFFNNNDYYETKINVHGIKPYYVDFIRKTILNIDKNRDLYYHHAVDSIVINYLGSSSVLWEWLKLNFQYDEKNNKYIEVRCDHNELENFILKDSNTLEKIHNQILYYINNDKFLYNYKIDKQSNITLHDRTSYGYETWYDDKKDVTLFKPYSRINLLEQSYDWIKSCFEYENYSEEKLNVYTNKLAIFTKDKPLFNKLKQIYEVNKNLINNDNSIKNKKVNPFTYYMNKNYPDYPLSHLILDNNIRIRHLKWYRFLRKTENTLVKQKQNPKAAYCMLFGLYWRFYLNRNNNWIPVAINKNILKFKNDKWIIDGKKLNQILIKNNISVKHSVYLNLYKGKILKNKINNTLYVVHGATLDTTLNKGQIIYLKPLKTRQDTFNFQSRKVTLFTFFKDFSIINTDTLGNIIKEISFSDFIKK